jgi:hypothetical protein
MGELVYHGPGGVQEIVFPTGVPVLESGELGVQSDGAKNPVKRKLVFVEEINPVGCKRRDLALARESIAGGHVVARRHFHEEGFHTVFPESLQQGEVIRENDEAMTHLLQRLDEVKVPVTLPG